MTSSLLSDIKTLESVCFVHKGVSEDISNEIATVKEQFNSFQVCVPFVGEFSVGKSSLLNHWLGDCLLPEDQGATTALATELRYGKEKAMYVVVSDSEKRKLTCLPKNEEESNAPLASQGLYAFCETPSSCLKDIAPLIPVDMPGINSGLEKHTKALYRYANQGSAFFLVFSPDQGTMHSSLVAFLEELELNGRPVWIVLNKCDTATEEKIKDVSSELVRCCQAIGIEPKGILFTSCLDPKTPDRLSEALASLDAELLRDRRFLPSVLNLIFRLRNHLCMQKDSCGMDLADIDKHIRECKRAKEELHFALKNEERRLHSRLATLPERVSEDMLRELNNQRESLISSLDAGKEAFTSRITGIINRVLTNSLQSHIEKDFRTLVEDLAARMQDAKVLEIDAAKIELLLKKANAGIKNLNEKMQALKDAGKVFKIVSVCLAIVTNVVGPLVELIIVFLPELVSFFYNPEEIKRRKIEEQLDRRIFPNVCAQVTSSVQEMLPDLERDMSDSIRTEWGGQITDVEDALINAQNAKTRAELEASEQLERLNNDILTLEQMYRRLELVLKEM